MKIQRQPSNVTITFSPKSYWLKKNTEDPVFNGEYCLTYRIDMSHKGKDDQEGGIAMYLSEKQAEEFRQAGFDELV